MILPAVAMFLKMSEVAAKLRISLSSAYALVEAGSLAHHRIGTGRGAIRISEEDLASYLDECRRGPVEKPPASAPASRPRLKHIKL